MRTNGMKLYRFEWYDNVCIGKIIFTNRKAALKRYSEIKDLCGGCRVVEMYKASDDSMRDSFVIEEHLKDELQVVYKR